uniref:DNA/RNA-binding protein Alba-like domain-containing protein n=1 Tax=Aegilops tauschii TaxID=37682 RepID=M8BAW3_AEGTA
MDRYQRVEKPRNETPIRENEIRITALGRMRNYIGYGMSLLEVIPLAMLCHFALSLSGVHLSSNLFVCSFQLFIYLYAVPQSGKCLDRGDMGHCFTFHMNVEKLPSYLHIPLQSLFSENLLVENGHDEITIKAMGRAINKTVMVAELIKRRVAGLHQNTSIESVGITDTWEPLEEGLVPYGCTYILFFRKRRKIYCHTNALLPQARDNSSCINDYPNIVQGTIGYVISRDPFPLLVGEVVVDLVAAEGAGAEVLCHPCMAHLLQPPAHRIGLYYCEFCRDNFPAAHHEADMNGPDTDTQAISNGPPPYDWGEEWEEDGDYYYNGRGRGRGRLRGRGRARGYYGGGRRGGYGYDYGYGGRGGYYEEQGGYFDGEPDEYHPPPGRGRGRGRRMEQSEYYNGEPDEYRPPPGRGRGRGRWMEQNEYFDEPYEYPPPGRGKLWRDIS